MLLHVVFCICLSAFFVPVYFVFIWWIFVYLFFVSVCLKLIVLCLFISNYSLICFELIILLILCWLFLCLFIRLFAFAYSFTNHHQVFFSTMRFLWHPWRRLIELHGIFDLNPVYVPMVWRCNTSACWSISVPINYRGLDWAVWCREFSKGIVDSSMC